MIGSDFIRYSIHTGSPFQLLTISSSPSLLVCGIRYLNSMTCAPERQRCHHLAELRWGEPRRTTSLFWGNGSTWQMSARKQAVGTTHLLLSQFSASASILLCLSLYLSLLFYVASCSLFQNVRIFKNHRALINHTLRNPPSVYSVIRTMLKPWAVFGGGIKKSFPPSSKCF